MRAAVVGAGGWGTALALVLRERGHAVRLWEFDPAYAAVLSRTRENRIFLPGVRLPREIRVTPDLGEALGDAEAVVLTVPSRHLRGVLARAPRPPRGALVVSGVKGVESDRLLRMSQVVRETWGAGPLAVLSGPSLAPEVARGVPTAVVTASDRPAWAREARDLLSTARFRVYTSSDVVGVECGGAFKNVMAIAAGVADALGAGGNAFAALVTRGLVEMARLGVALGARPMTFAGLSGMGDLVVTCMSPKSRNRTVGRELGQGRPLHKILGGMHMVAEGVETAKAAWRLSRRLRVRMPITEEVYAMLYRAKPPRRALKDLLKRQGSEKEFDFSTLS